MKALIGKNNYTFTTRKANNKPDVERIRQLHNGSYFSLGGMIGECVDDHFSAIRHTGVGSVIDIEIISTKDEISANDTITFITRDDGPGIADFDAFLTYAHKGQQQTVMNAYGCGPKSISAKELLVRTTHNGESCFVTSFAVGTDVTNVTPAFTDLPHGTEFQFTVSAKYLLTEIYRHDGKRGANDTTEFALLCEYLKENLAVVFAETMLRNPHISVNVTVKRQYEDGGCDKNTRPLKPLYPVFKKDGQIPYYHGSQPIPAFQEQPGDINMIYQFGVVTPNRPSLLGYFGKHEDCQYWMCRADGRVIGYTERLGYAKSHPDFNGIMGIVDFEAPSADYLPQTHISKTGFKDEDKVRVQEVIYSCVPGLSKLMKDLSGPSEHDLLCSNIITHMLTNSGANESDTPKVFSEYNIGKYVKKIIDIINFYEGIGYEVKAGKATLDSFAQAKMYLEALAESSNPELSAIKTVRLLSNGFVKGLDEEVRAYNQRLSRTRMYKGYKLELVDITKFPGANYEEVHKAFSRKK
jgi:hypothetical protein